MTRRIDVMSYDGTITESNVSNWLIQHDIMFMWMQVKALRNEHTTYASERMHNYGIRNFTVYIVKSNYSHYKSRKDSRNMKNMDMNVCSIHHTYIPVVKQE